MNDEHRHEIASLRIRYNALYDQREAAEERARKAWSKYKHTPEQTPDEEQSNFNEWSVAQKQVDDAIEAVNALAATIQQKTIDYLRTMTK